VQRQQPDKRMPSPEKEEQMEKEVAAHLGQLMREFNSGEHDENLVSNDGEFVHVCISFLQGLSILTRIHTYFTSPDETHFIINMDNGRILRISGDRSVRYQDVVSGGPGMTVMVRISGGKARSYGSRCLCFKTLTYPTR
jgi:hypothetical protein